MIGTPESRRQAIEVAAAKLHDAQRLLQEVLSGVQWVVGTGHDATVSVADARRATQVAEAKLAILLKRMP